MEDDDSESVASSSRPDSAASSVASMNTIPLKGSFHKAGSMLHESSAILFRSPRQSGLDGAAGNLSNASSMHRDAKGLRHTTHRESGMQILEPDDHSKIERPDTMTIAEICVCLKVRTSMLALGACDRIKRIAKAHPMDIADSPILGELLKIVEENPDSPLASAAMSTLATVALNPSGRQRICLDGATITLIKLIARADLSRPSTDKAVALLMNLAADHQNRRMIRDAGGVEALVSLMLIANADEVMEHSMGALHNVMLTDIKSKVRAVKAGVLQPILKIITAKGDGMCVVRGRLLLTELMRLPDIMAQLERAADELGVDLTL